jgi:hypothetical protein
MPYIVAQTSFDDVDDTVEFLVTEIQSSGIELASDVKDDVDTRTLEELEAHPLTSILRTHLCNLMDVPANDVPFILEAFLDTYQRGMPEVDEEEDDDRPNERICELCERPAPLTVHHLIPRSEHALMIKRGIFTQTECTQSTLPTDTRHTDAKMENRSKTTIDALPALPLGLPSQSLYTRACGGIQHRRETARDSRSSEIRRMELEAQSAGQGRAEAEEKIVSEMLIDITTILVWRV